MLVEALILILFALSGVDADCSCYTTPANTTITGSKVVISNSYDTSDFSTCYEAGCGFIAYSGSDSVGWSYVNVKFGSVVDTTGFFSIYDGKAPNANNLIKTYMTTDSAKNVTFSTSSPYIYVTYTQSSASPPNTYYGSVFSGGPLYTPTSPAPITSPAPTKPFNNTVFGKDPLTISHDLLILVNQKTSQGAAGLQALNNLVKSFVKLLSVTNTTNSESQTRLGLATITPYSPFYSAQGEIWNMFPDDVTGALPQAGVSINVDIVSALLNLLDPFFSVSGTNAPTRKNVQRSVLLFTAWWGDNSQALNKTVKDLFAAKGVNLAIVGYNTNSPQLVSNEWYNYNSLTTTTDQDVANFVNRYYLNSGWNDNKLVNNWCKKLADPVYDSDGVKNIIKEPSDYNGPNSTQPWSEITSLGQSGRYCNFQDTTYTYIRNTQSQYVGVRIFYELEVEQDFVKFYADGVEVESFTGIDVDNAYFQLDANVTTVRFTSDSAGVRRGFYVAFDEGKSKPP